MGSYLIVKDPVHPIAATIENSHILNKSMISIGFRRLIATFCPYCQAGYSR
jgi:hypothetical protein